MHAASQYVAVSRIRRTINELDASIAELRARRAALAELIEDGEEPASSERTQSFSARVIELVQREPGVERQEVLNHLVPQLEQRRASLNQIGNLVREKRLLLVGSRLFPPDWKGGLNGQES